MSMNFKARVTMLELQTLVAMRGLEVGGRVQKFIDSEMLRVTEPYIPMDTNELIRSGIRSTKIGSGDIKWRTPYARRQFYENKGGNGLRGAQWWERSKADNRNTILKGAKKIAGGK